MQIKLAFGGDVNFSRHRGQVADLVKRKKTPQLFSYCRNLLGKIYLGHNPDKTLVNDLAAVEIENILLKEYGKVWSNKEIGKYYDHGKPFEKIGNFFMDADIGYANLETPLSKNGRHIGSFCSSPKFAKVLRGNNIRIVSVANNHAFDAGENGFVETLNALRKNNIEFFGGGMNIKDARDGKILNVRGLKLGFLGYTAFCNSHFSSLAGLKHPGILPLYEPLLLEDIKKTKSKCDFLIVAPHFDIENTWKIHKNSVNLCHKLIDNGADLVMGSHSHVPKPIEIYKGKLIIYCLGNLIFPYSYKSWGKNLVAEITLSDTGDYKSANFYPLNSTGKHCFSPYIIGSKDGNGLLAEIKDKSKKIFNSELLLKENFLEVRF